VELTRRNIPFVKFGGLKFLEAAHIKDIAGAAAFCRPDRRADGSFDGQIIEVGALMGRYQVGPRRNSRQRHGQQDFYTVIALDGTASYVIPA
jgi:superfamily I DNA/RNA helicase